MIRSLINMPWKGTCMHLEVLGWLRYHVSFGVRGMSSVSGTSKKQLVKRNTDFSAKLSGVHFIIKLGIWENNIQGFFPESLGQNLAKKSPHCKNKEPSPFVLQNFINARDRSLLCVSYALLFQIRVFMATVLVLVYHFMLHIYRATDGVCDGVLF